MNLVKCNLVKVVHFHVVDQDHGALETVEIGHVGVQESGNAVLVAVNIVVGRPVALD